MGDRENLLPSLSHNFATTSPIDHRTLPTPVADDSSRPLAARGRSTLVSCHLSGGNRQTTPELLPPRSALTFLTKPAAEFEGKISDGSPSRRRR
jgi:hypothetical protein